MDTLDNNEIKSIWKRVKRYINPEQIKANTREELVKEIEKQMRLSGSSRKQGSMDLLVRKGFADRVTKVEPILDEISETQEVKALQSLKKENLPSKKVRFTKTKRVSIKKGKKFRTYLSKNIKITRSSYAGRSAYFVFNTRTKKRISWGFIE